MTPKQRRLEAYEFLALYQLGELGKKILADKGYSLFTKKEFIDKHGVGHDYFVQLVKTKDFGDKFYEYVTGGEREKLSKYLRALGNKDPKGWIQLMFSKQAKEAFTPDTTIDASQHTHYHLGEVDKDAPIGTKVRDFASRLSAANKR